MISPEFMAFILVPNRRHPYGTGRGGGYLEWGQKEGFEIRMEVERATADTIRRMMSE